MYSNIMTYLEFIGLAAIPVALYAVFREFIRFHRKFRWPNLGTVEHPILVRIERKVPMGPNVWKFHTFELQIWYDETQQLPVLAQQNLRRVTVKLMGEFDSPTRFMIVGKELFEDCMRKGIIWETHVAHKMIHHILNDSRLDSTLIDFDL